MKWSGLVLPVVILITAGVLGGLNEYVWTTSSKEYGSYENRWKATRQTDKCNGPVIQYSCLWSSANNQTKAADPTDSPSSLYPLSSVVRGDLVDETASQIAASPAAGPSNPPQRLSGVSVDREEIEQIVCEYDWPCDQALRVVYGTVNCPWGESRGDPAATNGISWGLFQLWGGHAVRWPGFWDNWMNASWNTAHAFELWSEQGWGPWSCKP